jgi:NAD(P)-dependent dehydrogenase (short-subunit alcohol dehydrogenase family)
VPRTSPGTWRAPDIADLSGQRFIVTGASSGLGAATTQALARAGAEVTMAVRNVEKAKRVAAELEVEADIRELDLTSLASVRHFVEAWGDAPIDVLVNNAGIMAVPRGMTEDGFELQIGTNHFGHFALTLGLLPHVRDRIVTVSSEFAAMGRIALDDLNWEQRRYRTWAAYCQSKLANLLFALELQRRLAAEDRAVRSVAAHPGLAITELQTTGHRLQDIAMRPLRAIGQGADCGALPTLYAATQDVAGGSYLGPDGMASIRVRPKHVSYPKRALDERVARQLWDASLHATAVAWPTS